MALSNEKIMAIREVDRKNLKQLVTDAETVREQTLDSMEEEHEALLSRIRELHERKGDIMRCIMSKAELTEYAKAELKKQRERGLDVLKKHLEDAQKGHTVPFSELSMRFLFSERNAHVLPLFIITDKDIETAIDSLPDAGIPAAERDAKIAEIDKEIKSLAAKVKAARIANQGKRELKEQE